MSEFEDQSAWPVWATEVVRIADPNPEWITLGDHEANHLQQLLASTGIGKVAHIGSTSVPDLPAKPILDFMAEIDTFDRIEEVADHLTAHDWHYVPPELDGRDYRRFFVKVKNEKRLAHLHIMQKGEARWEEQLRFRDCLRRDPALIKEYATLKRKLADDFRNDREAYTEAKAAFIRGILERK